MTMMHPDALAFYDAGLNFPGGPWTFHVPGPGSDERPAWRRAATGQPPYSGRRGVWVTRWPDGFRLAVDGPGGARRTFAALSDLLAALE